jgi:hypothetical protein
MKGPGGESARAALVLAGLCAGLSGCTSTYGTGQAPEMALFSEMTGGLLDREKKEPIEYQPRAPLVMPPTAGALPPPVESAEVAAAGNWPQDPDELARELDARDDEDPLYGGSQAEYERLKPLVAALPNRQPRPTTPVGGSDDRNDQALDIVHSGAQQEEFKQALAEAEGLTRTERRYLTDPPQEYRQPASTAPTEFEEVKKKKGFFLTRWLTGG